jgi:hypothetical protein
MSFLSGSRSKGHYPYQNHGGGYYKRPYGSGGILGKIFDAVVGSRRHSGQFSEQHYRNGHYSDHRDSGYDPEHRDSGYYPDRRHRKSSWS